jgi:hypothetical protein
MMMSPSGAASCALVIGLLAVIMLAAMLIVFLR